jgi:hypothetical protein
MHEGIAINYWSLLATHDSLPIDLIFEPLLFMNPKNVVNFKILINKLIFKLFR